jgi:hypothetical protein
VVAGVSEKAVVDRKLAQQSNDRINQGVRVGRLPARYEASEQLQKHFRTFLRRSCLFWQERSV